MALPSHVMAKVHIVCTKPSVYEADHSGRRWVVILSFSRLGEDVKPGTLSSIIRQSGLDRSLFR